MDVTKDPSEKKTERFLIRIEKDIHDFYTEVARRRRVPVAVVLRELLYQHMQERQKETSNG